MRSPEAAEAAGPPPGRIRYVRRKLSAYGQAQDYQAAGYGAGRVDHDNVVSWTARFHGRCERPMVMRQQDKDDGQVTATTDTWVRCRRCEACLRFRRAQWAGRINHEVVAAAARGGRSWFVTLTFRGTRLADLTYIASLRAEKATGKKWLDLMANQQAEWVLRELGPLVQRWLKRVRARASRRAEARREPAPRLRFVLVFEHGAENGRPHAHLVVHEAAGRVLEEELREEWSDEGFAQAKLLRFADRGAWYAAKYLTKGLQVRMRASLRYGGMEGASAFTAKDAPLGHSGAAPGGPRVDCIDPETGAGGRAPPGAAPQGPAPVAPSGSDCPVEIRSGVSAQ